MNLQLFSVKLIDTNKNHFSKKEHKVKYISPKKTLFLTAFAFLSEITVYALPIILQNMVLQKIITISFIILGAVLATLFLLVNGASTAIIDGEYEKKFMKSVKEGTASGEGENFHWNPLKLTLVKRVYYSKIIMAFLFPVIIIFFMEYLALLIYQFTD